MLTTIAGTALGQVQGSTSAQLTRARWLALLAFGGGMVGVATTYLAYTGRQQAAGALAIGAGIVGAVIGGIQVLAFEQERALERELEAGAEEQLRAPVLVIESAPAEIALAGLWW